MIPRKRYIDKVRPYIDTELIKVFTGLRRSGKSYLLLLVQDYLREQGVDDSQILAINLEQIRYHQFRDYLVLNDYIETFVENNQKKSYIFLDEIQEVAEFERVLNSLRATFPEKVDIYVTGSNAKLLSGELATLLGGRYIKIEVFPFSFEEYLAAKSKSTTFAVPELFNQYLLDGGMPFIVMQQMSVSEQNAYLEDVYNSIILKDVVARDKIRNPDLLQRIFSYLLANVGRTFSATSIVKYLKNEHISTTVDTLINYIRAGIEAYAFIDLKRYDLQGKKILSTQAKYYVSDHGLRQAIIGRNDLDIELVLENIVLVELLSRGYQVTVGKLDDYEVDFIATRNVTGVVEKQYIQVSYLIASDQTREREFRPLKLIPDNYDKLVLSLSPITIGESGIKHRKIYEWLLDIDEH